MDVIKKLEELDCTPALKKTIRKRYDEYYDHNGFYTFDSADFFNWSETPEGWSFWCNVDVYFKHKKPQCIPLGIIHL